MAGEPDFSHLPSGQLGWGGLVEQISNVDPSAERHFYEVKSDVDLSTNEGRAKVAKFVLGAANRDPAGAANRFDGRALMFLGVEHRSTPGIPGFEAMDLQRYVRKFTGTPGPEWDFERIDVGNNRAVIVISVAAPDPTMQPWLCQSDGIDKLHNGRIYIRADGNTREATAPEIQAMLDRRATAARPQVDLRIEAIGIVRTYSYDATLIDDWIADHRERLIDALPKPKMPSPPTENPPADTGDKISAAAPPRASSLIAGFAANQNAFQSTMNILGAMTVPEHRSRAEYLAEIDAWDAEVREKVPKTLDRAAGCFWPGVVFKITNLTDSYLDEPAVHIHFEGPVEGLRWRRRDDIELPTDVLPKPPREWGPSSKLPLWMDGSSYGVAHLAALQNIPNHPQRHGIVRFQNGGSVDLRVSLDELRPRGSWKSDNDDVVLIIREDGYDKLDGIWDVTIKGRDAVYEGSISIDVSPQISDFSEWLEHDLFEDVNADGTGEDLVDDDPEGSEEN